MGPLRESKKEPRAQHQEKEISRSRIPRLILRPHLPHQQQNKVSPASESPFSEEESREFNPSSSGRSARTISSNSFCSDDTGCPSSQSVSPVKTPSDTGHSPIGFCPGSDEDFTRKKCRIGTVAEGSVQAARYKKESKGGVIKPGSEADFSSSSSTGSISAPEVHMSTAGNKRTSFSRNRGPHGRSNGASSHKPGSSPPSPREKDLVSIGCRNPLSPSNVHPSYAPSSPSSSNSGSYKGSDCSPVMRRSGRYMSCGENHGVKPPNPEQYLTPLQQKEVTVRHLRTKLKESERRLHERESEIVELKSQLTRMREDWIEEECHRVEAQLALKEARKEIKQLKQVIETMRNSLADKDKGIQQYFVDINIQNKKLESLLQSMEMAHNSSLRDELYLDFSCDSPEKSLPLQTLEPGPGCQTPEVMPPDPGAGASPPSPEGLLEPLAPDSPIILESPHIEEEEIPPIATRRRGSPGQEEKEHTQGQPQSPNAPPSPSVGETLGDGINSSQSKPGVSIPATHPSLPGDGLTGKESEKPPERKRSERVRRAEPPKPEVVDSTESIPVSDEDSDAMVDDPNDEDFVPFRPRRSPRMSLRSSMAQRAGRSSMGTKMSCAHCRTPLQKGQTAYQRKGLPQLFCSSSCLTTFSKKPLGRKTCTFCKKEIWNTKDSVVVQTGSGGSFQEFCTSVCLSLYEAQQQRPIPQSGDPADATRCSICQKTGEVLHEVSNGSVVHRLCSDSCFSKFRANKGLKTNCCDQCGAYIYARPGSLGPELLFHDGQQKRFCNTTCLGAYKKKNTRVYPCVWCKTLCKNFEMLSHVDRNGKTSLFCSLCCTTSYKVKQAGLTGPPRPCSFCRRSLSDPCYYNKVDRTVYQFCSPSCWTKFQRTSPEGGIHLSCHYCHSLFSGKPEVLEWQDQVFQFCCRDCCEDFKRLRGVVSQCEHCRQEKLLHEKLRFSGVEKSFCSEGCVLLYKQDFTKKLGLCCITCTYCSQTCQRGVAEQLDGSTWDFCSEDCKTKYLLWYCKAARCHACKRQGKLLETIHWRGQIRHFCNQQCLLRFYSQQNQPNLDTQSGPESLLNSQSSESKPQTPSQTKVENNSTVRTPEENGNLGKIPVKTRSVPSVPTPPPPPPPATPRKNKAAMCKPLMQNRGVSCKVEMKSKGSQTEEWKPQVIVLPIPVPIFVPVPMHLYCQKVPVPFSMPIPVPVPMFLPTTLESTDKIVETIEELKVKIPSNPLEADILAMAEMIAEAEELDKASSDLCDLVSNQSAEGLLEDCDLFGTARDDVLAMAVKMANVLDEPGQDLEADFPKNPLDINPSVDFLFDCGLVGPEDVSTEQDLPRAMRKGQKRLVLSESCSRDSLSSQPSCTGLNYSYGVNAWKCWVQSKYANGETSKGDELRFGSKPMRIKEDILACSAAELNYGLAQFVREITRPNGERYEPDSIYYLCLGIQQYLLENNRMVNIFTDLYYLTFVQELNKSLSTWQPTLLPNNTVFSRVEEEHLWECKQLGVYSPFVLLNTLMFFNTKFFGLQTAEEHMQLSFTNVVRQSRKCTTPRGTTKVVSIRYYAPVRQRKGRDTGPGKRKREDETILEQRENRMNPLRCPVKFYEFYLSKCPESLRTRNDVFYLQPERSCIAESPLWYSVIPMDRSMLESMLNRILAVREIYEELGRPGEEDLD